MRLGGGAAKWAQQQLHQKQSSFLDNQCEDSLWFIIYYFKNSFCDLIKDRDFHKNLSLPNANALWLLFRCTWNQPHTHDVLNRARGGARRGSVRMCVGHTGNSQHRGNEAYTGRCCASVLPNNALTQTLGHLQRRGSKSIFTFLLRAGLLTSLHLSVSFQRQRRQVISL